MSSDRQRLRNVLAAVELCEREKLKLCDELGSLREALREAHDYYCGCEVPGNPALCVAHEAFDDRAAVPEERE